MTLYAAWKSVWSPESWISLAFDVPKNYQQVLPNPNDFDLVKLFISVDKSQPTIKNYYPIETGTYEDSEV